MSTNDWIRIIIVIAFMAVAILVGLKSIKKKSEFFTPRVIAATGVLTTIEIILQIIGNFIAIGPVSINLSLIPIALGAILYGPICGGFLGMINGLTVIFAPSTIAIFMPMNPLATIFLCLLKSTVSGVFRYLGVLSSSTRPPKPTTRPRSSAMGMMTRPRKRS